MNKMSVLAFMVLSVVAGTAIAANEQVIVEKLKPGTDQKISTFDANGVKKGALPLDSFPKPPFPANGYNATNRMVKVNTPEGEVWLHPFSVVTSAKAVVLTDCQSAALVVGAKTGQTGHGATSRGLGGCP